jgi:hypothetical protein
MARSIRRTTLNVSDRVQRITIDPGLLGDDGILVDVTDHSHAKADSLQRHNSPSPWTKTIDKAYMHTNLLYTPILERGARCSQLRISSFLVKNGFGELKSSRFHYYLSAPHKVSTNIATTDAITTTTQQQNYRPPNTAPRLKCYA